MSAAKITTMQLQEIRKKRAYGATYKQLAEEYGVSQTLIKNYVGAEREYTRLVENKKIKYKGLRDWILQEQITISKMARDIGTNYVTLYYILNGHNDPRKNSIDRILNYTGLTYEQAFAVNDD